MQEQSPPDPRHLPNDPRGIAAKSIVDYDAHKVLIANKLDSLAAGRNLGKRDLAFATELALGTVRHRLTLDCLISAFFRGRLENLQPVLKTILELGLYQLVWLERIPPFAAVDCAVEHARLVAGRKAGGLVNAVLRESLRHRLEPVSGDAPTAPVRAVRIDRQRWRLFDVDLFPEPRRDPATYLSLAMSYPRSLVDKWLPHLGHAQTEQVCLAGSLRPPLVLRANRLRITPVQLAERLTAQNVNAVVHPAGDAVILPTATPARHIAPLTEGLCQPQDRTAQAVVPFAPPRPGQKVLDLCAAPGTKTTQMAEFMENTGLILASDLSQERLSLVDDNCRRMGISCVRTVLSHDLERAAAEHGPFDLALVDAPCSNTGVLARRVEARYRITHDAIVALSDTQLTLLRRAARHVRPAGTLVYSTCSIEPEENEDVIERFLAIESNWRCEASRRTLPDAGSQPADWRDGGFVAVLRRES